VKEEAFRFDVAVVGLGYVGLPLILKFAEAGLAVLGFEADWEKISRLEDGKSYLAHVPSERVQRARKKHGLAVTIDPAKLSQSRAVLICVPTPLKEHREPDLSHITSAGQLLGPNVRKGMLVCLESSTYPGTTEGELRQMLEKLSGLTAGQDFALAFAPEREDPGNPKSDLKHVPRVVGGLTKACRDRAVELYGKIIDQIVEVQDCRTAEAVKLAENIFRFVNIALANELKRIYGKMGIDIWEVVNAAKTKPFGYMPFYPSPGVGGHCIPIDPFYLTWKAREHGMDTRFIELAAEINAAMPAYVIQQLIEALNRQGKALKGLRVLVVGLGYKPDIDDDRESPSYEIMNLLADHGVLVTFHDPWIQTIPHHPKSSRWAGCQSIPWEAGNLAAHDVAIIATGHRALNYDLLRKSVPMVVDPCGVIQPRHQPGLVPA
jgi:UDP-N-acetyl-D-glucosamine dehydrogenase